MTIINRTLDFVVPFGLPSVFFAQGDLSGPLDRIGRTPLDGSIIEDFITSGVSLPQDVAIDKRNNKLFFADSNTKKIESIDFNGNNRQEIINTGTNSLRGIAVDHINQKLYFVDTGDKNIKRSNLDGSNIEIIYTGVTSSVLQRITVNIQEGKIYWTDEDHSGASINKANLDGSNKITILGLGSSAAPRGIDIDRINNKLYWANDSQNVIQRSNLDGTVLENIVAITAPQNVTVDINNGHIYVGTNNGINRYNLDGTNFKSLISTPAPVRGIIFGIPDTIVLKSRSIDLFIIGQVQFSNIDLYINGFDIALKNIDFSIFSNSVINNNIPDIVIGHNITNNNTLLNTNGFNIFNKSCDLFINSFFSINSNISYIVNSFNTFNSSVNLFLRGPAASTNNNIDFIINGFENKQSDTCPVLDPTASIQITSELITIFQSRIDALINQIGKNVVLEFDPSVEDCPNCTFSGLKKRSTGIYTIGGPIPFSRGMICPYCKGRGILLTPVQKCIKALIKWNPKDAMDYGISVKDHKDIVRFKTFTSSVPDLVNANFAISNYDIVDNVKYKVKLIKYPILVGLRESRYCISFWRVLDI